MNIPIWIVILITIFLFLTVFEGDERIQYLAAVSERDRDSWIEALHIASYECMKMQLQSLREQIRQKTGKDPIDNPAPSVLEEYDNSGTLHIRQKTGKDPINNPVPSVLEEYDNSGMLHIRQKTGKDPIDNPAPSVLEEYDNSGMLHIRQKTGKDPIDNPAPSVLEEYDNSGNS